MKPLHTISVGGNPLAPLMQHLAQMCNYAFADRPFVYKQTTVSPEMGAMGTMFFTVVMIFEAESDEVLQEFLTWAKSDEKLRQMGAGGGSGMQIVR